MQSEHKLMASGHAAEKSARGSARPELRRSDQEIAGSFDVTCGRMHGRRLAPAVVANFDAVSGAERHELQDRFLASGRLTLIWNRRRYCHGSKEDTRTGGRLANT
jgi:hypothetical protein